MCRASGSRTRGFDLEFFVQTNQEVQGIERIDIESLSHVIVSYSQWAVRNCSSGSAAGIRMVYGTRVWLLHATSRRRGWLEKRPRVRRSSPLRQENRAEK